MDSRFSSCAKAALLSIVAFVSVGNALAQPRPKTAAPTEASLASLRAKIAQKCGQDPTRYLGAGTQNVGARCECYAATVSKLLSNEEVRYINIYDRLPDIPKDQFAKVQKACPERGAPEPAAKSAPKKQS